MARKRVSDDQLSLFAAPEPTLTPPSAHISPVLLVETGECFRIREGNKVLGFAHTRERAAEKAAAGCVIETFKEGWIYVETIGSMDRVAEPAPDLSPGGSPPAAGGDATPGVLYQEPVPADTMPVLQAELVHVHPNDMRVLDWFAGNNVFAQPSLLKPKGKGLWVRITRRGPGDFMVGEPGAFVTC